MDIILLQDVDKVGGKHEIVKVKDGYGRNYLIPQGMAIVANATNRNRLTDLIRQEDAKESKKLGDYQAIANKVKGNTVKIGAKAGSNGKLFGSVTNVQLSDALKDQFGVEVERKRVILSEEVKELGTYNARLNLHKSIECNFSFEVIGE